MVNLHKITTMRRLTIIVIMVSLISFGSHAMDELESIDISNDGNDYTLQYYNYREETFAYFGERDLQGGGYTWEGLVRAGLELENSPYLKHIEFDSEGDMLFLHSTEAMAIHAAKKVVEKLSSDLQYRETCIAVAQKGGYLE